MAKAPKTHESDQVRKKHSFPRLIIIVLGGVIVFALLGVSTYLFLQNQSLQKHAGSATNPINQEVADLTEKVGKLYDLPTGEPVTVATVSDVTKLDDQKFFVRAKNGDKVLIYKEAGKAILYRPSTNKIIEVGPVTSTEDTATEQRTMPVRVALYNGTTVNGLTKEVEASLQTLSSLQVDIVDKETASSSAYEESIVVDLSGKYQQQAMQLATFVKGKVGTLPEGEAKPDDADILIILGKSYVE